MLDRKRGRVVSGSPAVAAAAPAQVGAPPREPLLAVEDLSVRFETDDGTVHAVDRLSFSVERGEVMAIVGESGCGKTTAALSLVRLLPPTAVIGGRVLLEGVDLLA